MYTFTKSERLCKKQLTNKVFSDGISLKSDCFRIIYSEAFSQQEKLKIQIVVPKKIVSKAVDRNFIKRQIRESFRTNKYILLDHLNKHNRFLNCIIIYQSDKKVSTKVMQEKIIILFKKLINNLWVNFYLLCFFLWFIYIKNLFPQWCPQAVDIHPLVPSIQRNQ